MIDITKCICESGLPFERIYDARGIYLCQVCDKCKEKKLRSYRPEVLNDSNYDCDESIDEE